MRAALHAALMTVSRFLAVAQHQHRHSQPVWQRTCDGADCKIVKKPVAYMRAALHAALMTVPHLLMDAEYQHRPSQPGSVLAICLP
jgi:hypothetical protein